MNTDKIKTENCGGGDGKVIYNRRKIEAAGKKEDATEHESSSDSD